MFSHAERLGRYRDESFPVGCCGQWCRDGGRAQVGKGHRERHRLWRLSSQSAWQGASEPRCPREEQKQAAMARCWHCPYPRAVISRSWWGVGWAVWPQLESHLGSGEEAGDTRSVLKLYVDRTPHGLPRRHLVSLWFLNSQGDLK